MQGKRYLVVTADDFGIGPETTAGILELARQRRVTGTVLLVNSPHAASAVTMWRQAGQPVELGWHPCLTLDSPVLPAREVPTLVGPDGRFRPLGAFLRQLYLGRVSADDIEAELRAQYELFYVMVGHFPTVVNSHHHVQIFEPVGTILRSILTHSRPMPYLRRVREPWRTLITVPGARRKRLLLATVGRRDARRQEELGLPGNDWLAGVTDPPWVADACFLTRWLRRMPGRVVELTCHPGFEDPTLIGRDCTPGDGQIARRVHEWHLLEQMSFPGACRDAGFELVAPRELLQLTGHGEANAA